MLFWKNKWYGSDTLRNLFPFLFNVMLHPNATVLDMGCFEGGSWQWGFQDEFAGKNLEIQEELIILSHILAQL